MFQILNYQTLPSSGRLLVFDLLLMGGIFFSEGLYYETKQPGLFLCLIPQRNFILHQKDIKDSWWWVFQVMWDQCKTLKVFCKVSRCRMSRVEGWLLLQAGLSLGGYCGYCLLLSGVFVINTVIHLTMLTWHGPAPHSQWMLKSVSLWEEFYISYLEEECKVNMMECIPSQWNPFTL